MREHARQRSIGRAACVLSMLFAMLSASACGLLEAPPPLATATPANPNLLKNGDLSSGSEGWASRDGAEWSAFSISGSAGHSGTHSLALRLRGDESAAGAHSAGALQSLTPAEFPAYVSGFYRADAWDATAPYQFLQVVVRINGGDFPDGPGVVHEVRLELAGEEGDLPQPWNARYVYLRRAPPELGRWVYFGYPLRQAVASRLGYLPKRWDSIEVSFEVRYEGKTAGAATSADVYYDDLYVGPQAANPNRPPDP